MYKSHISGYFKTHMATLFIGAILPKFVGQASVIFMDVVRINKDVYILCHGSGHDGTGDSFCAQSVVMDTQGCMVLLFFLGEKHEAGMCDF